MTRRRRHTLRDLAFGLVAAAVAFVLPGPTSAAELRRVAVIVGHDQGGPDTQPLRFAVSDAERMHAILTTIGGIAPDDALLLRSPTAETLLQALGEAERRADGGLVFFYYSGHAKDGQLRLGTTTLAIDTLRSRLDGLKARTRVAVLDACNSGGLIRRKGTRTVPAFTVRLDQPTPRGLAVLTSSTADEESQESDLLGASFFTHHLASGLLGDADADHDGTVTLQEAYTYAYARTVAVTAGAQTSMQHPTFDFDLSGSGQLWLTRPASSSSSIVLPAAVSGEFVVVDTRRRTLVAEVTKEEGQERRLALPPGRYEVKQRDGNDLLVARVLLEAGDATVLDLGSMRRVALAKAPAKGSFDWAGDLATLRPVRLSLVTSGGGQAFLSQGTRDSLWPSMPVGGLELEWRDALDAGTVLALDLSGGAAPLDARVAGTQLATNVTQGAAGVSWLKELDLGRWRPFAGVRVGLLGARRSFAADVFAAQHLLTAAPGLVLGVTYDLTPSLSVGLRARGSYVLYFNDENLSLGFADAGAILRWELP